ncbi:GGDEF domain-containing protein [Catenovulum sp. SM1970]|uniref:GGDEF domain-containing protein n=1 Tax=Marinifaba aquimaris TaxID=2741323 RepID=UPI0015727D4B|nr:GGDEF domain-containing protein [Marinifaba aquimaris]NTS75416.1 GGDEF domain-containing protein [Marinifaba aquimaris]
MRKEKLINIIIFGLIFMTAVIVLLQTYSLNHTLVVNANTGFNYSAISDGTNGGQSSANIKINGDQMILECEIVHSDYPWPYCEIAIALNDLENENDRVGFDLSSFDTVTTYVRFEEPTHVGIRLQIRSYNPAYSSLFDEGSWKYNAVEYFEHNSTYPAKIPMSSLQVATWWLVERAIAVEHSAPDFDHAMTIEIATGNNIPAGKYRIIVDKLEFKGKLFSNSSVYIVIILMWVLSAIGLMISHLTHSREALVNAQKRAKELKQLNQILNVKSRELKDQAERDPLTGALNRSGIKNVFDSDFSYIDPPNLSLIFIDIDHFKPINDTHGHNVGDLVLKSFAKLISEYSRNTDLFARWGGEEFLLACPNTKLNEAADLAESLRHEIEGYDWPEGITLTASFGVAHKQADESPSAFIERADKALYAAKARGRNQVVVSKANSKTPAAAA